MNIYQIQVINRNGKYQEKQWELSHRKPEFVSKAL